MRLCLLAIHLPCLGKSLQDIDVSAGTCACTWKMECSFGNLCLRYYKEQSAHGIYITEDNLITYIPVDFFRLFD